MKGTKKHGLAARLDVPFNVSLLAHFSEPTDLKASACKLQEVDYHECEITRLVSVRIPIKEDLLCIWVALLAELGILTSLPNMYFSLPGS